MPACLKISAGYALTEVLVAAAIAGAVLAAGMSAFAGSAAGLRSAETARHSGLVARNIQARLQAGLSPALAVDGYDGWRVELTPLDLPRDPVTGAVLSRADLTGPQEFRLSVILVEDGAGRQP